MEYPQIRLIEDKLHIGDVVIDAALLYAMVSDAPRVLWRFLKRDGEIVAIPISEEHVIWVDPHDEGERS